MNDDGFAVAAVDDPTRELVQTARAQLLAVEASLRDAWYANIDLEPTLAARLNMAARSIHNAVEALSTEALV